MQECKHKECKHGASHNGYCKRHQYEAWQEANRRLDEEIDDYVKLEEKYKLLEHNFESISSENIKNVTAHLKLSSHWLVRLAVKLKIIKL